MDKLTTEELMNLSMEERVQNGITYLDVNHQGWAKEINLGYFTQDTLSDIVDENAKKSIIVGNQFTECYDAVYLGMDQFPEEKWGPLRSLWVKRIRIKKGWDKPTTK